MRYIIGIDLGTTNSCVAYVDTLKGQGTLQPLLMHQLAAEGYVEARAVLPSYCYQTTPDEWAPGALALPWGGSSNYIVGMLALEAGMRRPGRLVAAAKSWLAHSAAARRDPILPLVGEASLRLSPVEATARYLKHLAAVWDWGHPEDPFCEQEVVVGIPASFDEVARALTVEAAVKAAYGPVTLLEEPQAAFYSWVEGSEAEWSKSFHSGDHILVVDVGGGTSDFSIISVTEELAFQRMAVGDHLLLGGENIDMAIAHYILEAHPPAQELTQEQWHQLLHQSRRAKEQLLGHDEESYRISVGGKGARLVEGSYTAVIERREIERLTIEGFFGLYPWEEAQKLPPARGIRTMGLPYEDEPSITKHLAAFLATHNSPPPTHILFNGGTLQPKAFQEAIINSIKLWYGRSPKLLTNKHYESAVARGAAYYGKVRRGLGVAIRGGSPRSYYLALDDERAITLLARGAQEGESYRAPQQFILMANKPVTFDLYTSHTRLHDSPGEVVTLEAGSFHRLPPIRTLMRYGKGQSSEEIHVHLTLTLSPIGTLELSLSSDTSPHKWKLEFQLRSSSGQEDARTMVQEGRRDITFHTEQCQKAQAVILAAYNDGGITPHRLVEELERALSFPRKEWSPSVLRGLWPALIAVAPHRAKSDALEARWWHLAGWLLRPGYGYPLDDFRMKELWKVILAELKRPKPSELLLQQLICFRRVAGGLSRGQQLQLAQETLVLLLPQRGSPIPAALMRQPALYEERLRMVAAMEWIDNSIKYKLATALAARLAKGQGMKAEWWALGRLAARHLVYAPLSYAFTSEQCSSLLTALLTSSERIPSAFLEQAARLTGYREVDLPVSLRDKILTFYPEEALKRLLTEVVPINRQDEEALFGDVLPPGLRLVPGTFQP